MRKQIIKRRLFRSEVEQVRSFPILSILDEEGSVKIMDGSFEIQIKAEHDSFLDFPNGFPPLKLPTMYMYVYALKEGSMDHKIVQENRMGKVFLRYLEYLGNKAASKEELIQKENQFIAHVKREMTR